MRVPSAPVPSSVFFLEELVLGRGGPPLAWAAEEGRGGERGRWVEGVEALGWEKERVNSKQSW